jgi:hypothetical protein
LGICGPFAGWGLAIAPGMRVPSNLLFFMPQLMFPFFGAVRTSPYGTTAAFSTAAQYALSAALWGGVAVAYARLGRSWPVHRLAWLSPIVIVFVTLTVNWALSLAGTGVQLDAP